MNWVFIVGGIAAIATLLFGAWKCSYKEVKSSDDDK